jgi:NAD(P)-dependent dehydrogenase (short-subunit alcohol dehydrogenase family)
MDAYDDLIARIEVNNKSSNALGAFLLDQKVSIVTGAASGLGRVAAKLFADVGARVVALDVNGSGAEKTAEDIRASGGEAIGVRCDISSEPEVISAFEKAEKTFGPTDVLVNCAAYRGKAEFMEVTTKQWDDTFAVTTKGTFLCLRAAVRQMQASKRGGSIVNISSVCAQHTSILANIHYDAAKAGVDAITRAAAVEFATDKIRVNSVMPGGIKTEGLSNIQSSINFRGPATMPGRMMLGYADPIEIARAVLFLASPAASYITGHVMAVDGGFLAS